MVNQIKDVQPIRNIEDLHRMEWALGRFCGERDVTLFKIGCNTALRCSDILHIKTKDLLKLKNKREKIYKIKEKKTDKTRNVDFTAFFDDILPYVESCKSEWLFPSRKGDKPISVTQAYRQLNKAADMAEVDHIGTHTMRKTAGYWLYKRTNDIVKVQRFLNHTNPSVTRKYIGISDEEMHETLRTFNLFA